MTWRQLSATATAVVLAAALAGCGDGDGAPTGDPRVTTPTSTAAPTSEGPTSAPPTPDARLLEFEIVDGQASPPLDRVAVAYGEAVRIAGTSDQPDGIHLHGYGRSAQVGPGEEGVIEFVADQTGLFELETHESGLILLQLEVR